MTKVYVLMSEVFYEWVVDSVYATKEAAIVKISKRKEKNPLLNFTIKEYELHV